MQSVAVKFLTNAKVVVDLPLTATVGDLKLALERHDRASYKLHKIIFQGKVYTDEVLISNMNIGSAFVVAMTSKAENAAELLQLLERGTLTTNMHLVKVQEEQEASAVRNANTSFYKLDNKLWPHHLPIELQIHQDKLPVAETAILLMEQLVLRIYEQDHALIAANKQLWKSIGSRSKLVHEESLGFMNETSFTKSSVFIKQIRARLQPNMVYLFALETGKDCIGFRWMLQTSAYSGLEKVKNHFTDLSVHCQL